MPRIGFNWGRDQRGNVALIFAILAPVVILIAGGAVDVTNASMRQAQLQQSVDAAAVAAIARYSPAYQQALTMPGDGPITTPNLSQNAQSVFSADYQTSGTTTISNFGVTAWKTGSVVYAQTTANAVFNTSFLGLMGRNNIKLSATSTAADNMPVYINYYILVDVSQSMGIAATSTDMSNLYSRVVSYNNGSNGETGCVFGCHVTAPSNNNGNPPQTYTNEYLAHNFSPKITLRIDSAVTAIQDVITQAQNAAGTQQNIKIGLYTISDDPVSHQEVNTISTPSSNYNNLKTLATNIDLGNNVEAGDGDSSFANEIAAFAATLPASGTGANSSSPVNYVFLITDGFVDTMPASQPSGSTCYYGSHCVRAFDPTYCNPLKANATVGVIYTTYTPIYNQNNPANGYETNYNLLVIPYASSLQSGLTSCASSSSLFFQASDGPGIDTAMSNLFAATLKTARITQ